MDTRLLPPGGARGEALKSNLQKNEELKSLLLQETPWVLQAENDRTTKEKLAMLFDALQISKSSKSNIDKLKQMQLPSGGFAWFKGGNEYRYITQYIITGIGRLQSMNAIPEAQQQALTTITKQALQYLDEEITRDYKNLQQSKADVKKITLGLYKSSIYTCEASSVTSLQ